MTHHSPVTGRFISHATYARWYEKGAPKERNYRSATRRWAKARAEKLAAPLRAKAPAPLREEAKAEMMPDYYEIEYEEPEFEATLDYEED
jgi:hypothetical protein